MLPPVTNRTGHEKLLTSLQVSDSRGHTTTGLMFFKTRVNLVDLTLGSTEGKKME